MAGQVRAALRLAVALLAGVSAPLAAQDNGASAPPAEATPPADPAKAAAGPIVLIDAPEPVLKQFGADPLDETVQLCLADGESALLASDRVTFTLEGEACFAAAEAEERAWRAERRETDPEFARQEAEERALTERLAQSERRRSSRPAALRTRTGAVRGTVTSPPRPVIFRVYSGSPAVLERLARGTLVQRNTALCLKDGEQVTINASTGQSVTYRGPGCLNRKARPTRNNIGGFTFG